MNYHNIYFYICVLCKKKYQSGINYYSGEKTFKEEPLCIDCIYKDFEGNQLNLPYNPNDEE